MDNHFKCDQCNFQASQKMTLKKHINMKHSESSINETVSSFIYRLELDNLAEEYRAYFKRYGFNIGEAYHVEKMIRLHGPEYFLNPVE